MQHGVRLSLKGLNRYVLCKIANDVLWLHSLLLKYTILCFSFSPYDISESYKVKKMNDCLHNCRLERSLFELDRIPA
jgi:hypothetical protein